ncbi:cuticular protein 60 precursor [Acyrthosiphon pisum]|uniref:ACYPI001908 protein n=1 Tax=Acyrthosiphon pisum TaxID=7029 RepID=C4WRY5_ACYPI|nr:cuticular protein 60 precursor [Acyrthosiphon pisum]BAH70655.1 ACYPI001908 [Acyrthosiphon pisum]|eukprot:NP_001155448.2 cuticular protein 60 precursor [Acyrthosiphon pisum]
MAAKLSYSRVVVVFVLAACAVASASPFQLHDHEYHPQQGHYDSSTAEHSEAVGDSSHKPGSTYHFQYAVHDPLTGDEKSQNEVGDGHGSVRGTYSLVEPDGSTRVVEYTADDEHGFRAEVKRIEPVHRQQHDLSQSVASPSYKFDFAAEHAAAAPPQVDYELQQSLHYNYPLQEHQPELHKLSSSHR